MESIKALFNKALVKCIVNKLNGVCDGDGYGHGSGSGDGSGSGHGDGYGSGK